METARGPRRWLTGLAARLKDNGYIDDESKIDSTPAFAVQVGKKAREMGHLALAGLSEELADTFVVVRKASGGRQHRKEDDRHERNTP